MNDMFIEENMLINAVCADGKSYTGIVSRISVRYEDGRPRTLLSIVADREGNFGYAVLGLDEIKSLKPIIKPAKKSASGSFYVCPQCGRLVEKYEQAHGNMAIKHCKWCGYALYFEDEAQETRELKSRDLVELGLSTRVYHILKRRDCVTIGDLTMLTRTELRRAHGLGVKGIDEIASALQAIGLSLRLEKEENE